MGRQKPQPATLDELFDTLMITPVWVGPLLAVIVFVVLFFFAPILFRTPSEGVDMGALFRPMMRLFAVFAFILVIVTWGVAELHKVKRRRLFDRQNGLESIRRLSWQAFEELVAEAYRRRGYVAQVVGNTTGDGGVDVELRAAGQLVLVQCKQWLVYSVGVKPVRELLGVVVSRCASSGVLITSGRFTAEAIRFAKANPMIQLIDGNGLAALMGDIQPNGVSVTATAPTTPTSVPPPLKADTGHVLCPKCNSPMVRRTAKRGYRAGAQFYGCSRFPDCHGKRDA
jgi:restriction system protein